MGATKPLGRMSKSIKAVVVPLGLRHGRRHGANVGTTKVEITEFVTCGNCAGSGREPGTATAEHRFGVHCSSCQGMRKHPDISIQMELPEELTGFITAEIQAEMVG